MAIQRNGTLLRTPGIGLWLVPLKFQAPSSAGACTVLAGNNVVSAVTTAANANVAIVTMKDSLIATSAFNCELSDDGANGAYVSIGTFSNLGTTTAATFKVSYFTAGGSSAAYPNAAVASVMLVVQNSSVTTGN
jgi:hypothetical protein